LLAEQALSLVQAGPAVHLAAVHTLLTPQDKSSPQALALHFTLVHTAPEEVQSVSTEQADAAPQTTEPPQKAFVVQIRPLLMPEGQVRVQMPLVAPQIPLSQSAALWQTVAVPVEHVPPPHELLSQSAALWQVVVVPVEHVPPPHELLSQSAALWHVVVVPVAHVPPVHEPLSQAAPL